MNKVTINDFLAGTASEQEVFDYVVTSLFFQGRGAVVGSFVSYMHMRKVPKCRLRGYGGTKCAIGFLIPDDSYSKDLEEVPLDKLGFLRHVRLDLHDRPAYAYVRDLPKIQADKLFLDWMLRAAKELADSRGLSDHVVSLCVGELRLRGYENRLDQFLDKVL